MDKKRIEILPANPAIQNIKRVATYARVSVDDEDMLHSLAGQVKYFSTLVSKKVNWVNAGIYSDEGVSGTLRNSPNFIRLLEDCRAGKVDVIVTKAISRFGRNTAFLLETIRELKALGVEVIFEEQNISTFTSDGELLITLLATLAQSESRTASENQIWSIRNSYKKGEPRCHSKQFGFDVKNKNLVPNEELVPIVREIFNRVVGGESYSSIAKDLNKRKIIGPYGGKWTAHRVNDVVTNEKYIGDTLLQKTFVNNYLEKKVIVNKGQLPKYYAIGTHEGIIDKSLFELAANEAKRRRTQHDSVVKKTPEKSLFSGVIYCPHCGKNYRKVLQEHHLSFS